MVSSGVDGGGARASPRVSHGGWTEDGARETLCFHAGAADAGERHAVGILEIRRGAPEAALAIAAPAGMEVVDAAPYTDGRVLVLLQPSSATRGAEEGEGGRPGGGGDGGSGGVTWGARVRGVRGGGGVRRAGTAAGVRAGGGRGGDA